MSYRSEHFSTRNIGVMECGLCGKTTIRRGNFQKYCASCSEVKAAERANAWAKDNPLPPNRVRAIRHRMQHRAFEIGAQTSNNHASKIVDPISRPLDARWLVRFNLPFSYSASKNAVFSLGKGGGHLYRRQMANAYRDEIIVTAKQALRGIRIFENKIWIGIHVQKPNHKGDGVNVVDTVCDAMKVALGVDDRWFALRAVDWEIVKENPHLTIEVAQEADFDARICHCCGRVLSLDNFSKSKGDRLGIGRKCGDCSNGRIVHPDGVEPCEQH